MMDWSEHYIDAQQLLRRYQEVALARDWEAAGRLAAELSTVAASLLIVAIKQGD